MNAAAETPAAAPTRTEMMTELKALLDKHGTEAIFGLLTEATENLASLTSTVIAEQRVFTTARRLNDTARAIVREEMRTGSTLGDSLEVMLDCESEMGG